MPLARATLIDTETTGLDEPEVIQLAYSKPFTWAQEITAEDYTVLKYRPGKPIANGAKAVHHIIEADLVDAAPWPGNYPLDTEYLVGHGVDFDWKALGSQPVKRICTLALSRLLYDERTDSHSLAALMYMLYDDQEARLMARLAHDAHTDLQMNWLLLKELIADAQKTGWVLADFEDLWKLSEHARVPLRLTFGKFGPKDGKPGMLYSEVETGYLEWMLRQDFDEYERQATQRELQRRR